LFDGAMGTALQLAGLSGGELPEAYNIEKADVVQSIHRSYLQAGCDVLTTNTFGANGLKVKDSGYTVAQVIAAAVENCRKAIADLNGDAFVALDIGPSGKLMDLAGGFDFDAAYELFREQVVGGAAAGADLILFETFTDIVELKAGILAAKEHSDLPVFCSLTFEDTGRMLMGTDPATAVRIVQDMGISAVGVNCSLGPADMLPLVREMAEVAKIPVLAQPNAGLPRIEDGQTYYDVDAEDYARCMAEILEAGAAVVGGCCGTTPAHIRALRDRIDAIKDEQKRERFPALRSGWLEEKITKAYPSSCSVTNSVVLDGRVRVIGERINPTGKKKLKEALIAGDYAYTLSEAIAQAEAGADIVNVNAGLPDIDEGEALLQIVRGISARGDIPLMIDCKIPEYTEKAVRYCRGKAIINSVSGEQASMDEVLPIAAKYGTAVVALALDENGIPASAEARLEILEKILKEAARYGIGRDRIIVDMLALTVSAEPGAVMESLKAITWAKEVYGVAATLGASNVSFGLPERKLINGAFLSMAVYAGLDAPITDPTVSEYIDIIRSAEVLVGRDPGAESYIGYNQKKQAGAGDLGGGAVSVKSELSLAAIIEGGFEDRAAAATKTLLTEHEPLWVIDHVIVPAMEEIGRRYEDGTIFLPQMMRSADTVKRSFDVLKAEMDKSGERVSAGRIILATVKGDIHDIGKNIVKSMLENYGYDIIDLGKDVPPEQIVETAKKENIKLVGLSALMTTTIGSMEETIRQLKAAGLTCKTAVGGAVLTQAYADRMGADYYCENAVEAVKAAKEVFVWGATEKAPARGDEDHGTTKLG
jgi:5-methyltetrahydrofolate--homocysteine methyltransferase